MFDLISPLKATIERSTLNALTEWFSFYPDDAAWYVISDYCLGDKTKFSDSISFSILLNHDKIQNIKEYINHFAPKDIKSTRNISPEFLQYVNSPVIFNFTFLVDRNTKLLKEYASGENMKDYLSQLKDIVQLVQSNSSLENNFFISMLKRLKSFERDFDKKSPNLKLSRQIYLVSVLAGLIFFYLTILKRPSYIQWVSDRDAIIERHDGVAFDLAYLTYVLEYSNVLVKEDEEILFLPEKPHFIFPTPEKSGKNHFDELIRIPDYLAGTLADLDVTKKRFTKDKYNDIFEFSLVNSPNHAIIQITGSSNKLTTRKYVFNA